YGNGGASCARSARLKNRKPSWGQGNKTARADAQVIAAYAPANARPPVAVRLGPAQLPGQLDPQRFGVSQHATQGVGKDRQQQGRVDAVAVASRPTRPRPTDQSDVSFAAGVFRVANQGPAAAGADALARQW